MIRAILNADDLGLSDTINRSVAIAHAKGVLTSASLLLSRDASAEAVKYLRDYPTLDIGLHLDLDRFMTFDAHGLYGITIEDIDTTSYEDAVVHKLDQIVSEIDRQFQLIFDLGIRPSHVDGHHNVHVLPAILPHVVRAMQRFGVNKMRFSRKFYLDYTGDLQSCQQVVDTAGIKYPDKCIELDEVHPIGKLWGQLDHGTTEVIIHTDLPDPGRDEWRIAQYVYLTENQVVTDLSGLDVHLISYADL